MSYHGDGSSAIQATVVWQTSDPAIVLATQKTSKIAVIACSDARLCPSVYPFMEAYFGWNNFNCIRLAGPDLSLADDRNNGDKQAIYRTIQRLIKFQGIGAIVIVSHGGCKMHPEYRDEEEAVRAHGEVLLRARDNLVRRFGLEVFFLHTMATAESVSYAQFERLEVMLAAVA